MEITKEIIFWYNQKKRNLPWRETIDPYKIWLSEIILQQTRVAQGMAYYLQFISAFPTVRHLASASEEMVLKLWQGLGYYSRARNLHATAREIVEKYNGIFPENYLQICKLKGIGTYTAAAICSFAWKMPIPVLDGNVYRVLARLFQIETPIDTAQAKKIFTQVAHKLLDTNRPDISNQAFMEFGALQCTPATPNCDVCPVMNFCLAFKNKKVVYLPVKQKKQKITNRFITYLIIYIDDQIYFEKRTGNDIWKNLYQFPLIETESPLDITQIFENNDFKNLFQPDKAEVKKISNEYIHLLSHQRLHIRFIEIKSIKKLTVASYLLIPLVEADNYPVPKIIENYLRQELLLSKD